VFSHTLVVVGRQDISKSLYLVTYVRLVSVVRLWKFEMLESAIAELYNVWELKTVYSLTVDGLLDRLLLLNSYYLFPVDAC
jgi:hypothetical protein